ncbi:sensor histidine kinase [Patiriisocius hiemis]|uniref:histidine kinase n=1 Tax=Patiriisocius hiemis TaxID=3075604 RepID=A0ABU2YD15_9FLAO|nr:sensor histidine kinase [Constantimarinum sp. W242]MDT0556081.1 sensor histidine kinase [Constantimarinum sp. W242]
MLIILFGFLSITFSFSQEVLKQKIDSTLLSIKNIEDYDQKKAAYFKINRQVSLKGGDNYQELFTYIITQDNSALSKAVNYLTHAKKVSQKGDIDKSIDYKLAGLKFAKELDDEYLIIEYYIGFGTSYAYKNEPDKSLFYLNQAEELAIKEENRSYLWSVFYQKGVLEVTRKNYEVATNHYLKMWEEIKDYENTSRKRFALYILVDYFSQIDKPLELAKFTGLLADAYQEANPNLPSGHMPIKNIFEKNTDSENIPRLKKAITISDSLNNINSLAYSSIALANTYLANKRSKEAVSTLNRAIKKVESTQKPQVLIDLYTKMETAAVAASDFENACKYKAREGKIRDSLASERMQENIAEVEVKYDTEKKERKIAEQNLELKKEEQQKQNSVYGLIALVALLLLSFLFFRYRLKSQRTIASQTEEIQKQEITELQQKNKLLALNSMIEGQEAERLRIAKDLHDSLGGLLSTVKAHFTTIQNEIKQLEEFNLTDKTNHLIDEACIEVRRISYNMMPHALSISGLKGAIEDFGTQLNDEGYTTTIEISNLPDIENTKEVMIYRLIQEIISNIRKHAEAKEVLIQLLGNEEGVNLIIEDDGKGFNYKKAVKKGGLGLKSINSRVQFLDGTIDWDTQKNEGTSVLINIPIS